MEFSAENFFTGILAEALKNIWMFKDIFFIFGALVLFTIVVRITADLLSRKSKIKWFLNKKKIRDLQNLTPTQFENYIEELFRSLGYKTRTVGGRGDGGIDVEAEKDGLVHYIQCKKFINRKVPVGAVRDFYGAITDKVDGGKGYFITTNVFTLATEKFAEGRPIELVDRFKLMKYIKLADVETPKSEEDGISCPSCGGQLVKRKGKYGEFLGCSNYPKCKHTEQINDAS